jgi:hypothetical protein
LQKISTFPSAAITERSPTGICAHRKKKQRVFSFQANNPAQVQLQLKNWREWVGDESTIKQFQVTVQVSE